MNKNLNIVNFWADFEKDKQSYKAEQLVYVSLLLDWIGKLSKIALLIFKLADLHPNFQLFEIDECLNFKI